MNVPFVELHGQFLALVLRCGLLREHQQEIEQVFGGPLEWQSLPGKRACRVRKVLGGGCRSPHETWADTHRALVDAMIRLDKAFRPLVQKLNV